MAEHRRPLRAARPVLAGAILARRKRRAVRLRSRQHVMAVRRVAAAVDDVALFAERGLLAQIVGGAVQISDILRDHDALRVLPWSLADAVARVDRGLAVGFLGREVGMPALHAGSIEARGLRQFLAMVVGASDAAEIGAV